ncbi:hypothetical protein D3C78_77840 [compost metagenome]
MFSGYVMTEYFWAQQAAVASEKLASGDGKESAEFYKAKINLAYFYFERMSPRTQSHAEAMVNS